MLFGFEGMKFKRMISSTSNGMGMDIVEIPFSEFCF